jgi:hypothetical protein
MYVDLRCVPRVTVFSIELESRKKHGVLYKGLSFTSGGGGRGGGRIGSLVKQFAVRAAPMEEAVVGIKAMKLSNCFQHDDFFTEKQRSS